MIRWMSPLALKDLCQESSLFIDNENANI